MNPVDLDLKPIPMVKRHKCLDPKFGIRCRWGTPTGTICRFRSYGGRPLKIDPETKICENFGLRCKTNDFKQKLRELK